MRTSRGPGYADDLSSVQLKGDKNGSSGLSPNDVHPDPNSPYGASWNRTRTTLPGVQASIKRRVSFDRSARTCLLEA